MLLSASQHSPAGRWFRSLPRLVWKRLHRQLRIARRETAKAFEDMAVFGSGCYRVGPDVPDSIRHVPIGAAGSSGNPEPNHSPAYDPIARVYHG